MSFLTDAQMDAVLDSIWGSGSPVTWYIALFTTTPAQDGTGGVEAAWSGYARVASTNDPTNWPNAAASLKSNAALLDFGTAGSGPTVIHSFGFYDDPTSVLAADLWAVVDLTGAPVTVNNGAAVTFPIGSIDLTNCL